MERLLIVEDDTDLREGLVFTFHSEHYEVMSADTVKKAKEYLQQIFRCSYKIVSERQERECRHLGALCGVGKEKLHQFYIK